MTSVPQLAASIQHWLGERANRLAQTAHCIRRQRYPTGASSVQALLCGPRVRP